MHTTILCFHSAFQSFVLVYYRFTSPKALWSAVRKVVLTVVLSRGPSCPSEGQVLLAPRGLTWTKDSEKPCWSQPSWRWQPFKLFKLSNQIHLETQRVEHPGAAARQTVWLCWDGLDSCREDAGLTKAFTGLTQPYQKCLCNYWWPEERLTFSKSSMQNDNLPLPCCHSQ